MSLVTIPRWLRVVVLVLIYGGGGGIALLAGMSGLFTFPRFVAAVALAALPVPLFVMLTAAYWPFLIFCI